MTCAASINFFLGVYDPLVFVRFNKRLKPAKLFVLFCVGDFCLTLFDHKLQCILIDRHQIARRDPRRALASKK